MDSPSPLCVTAIRDIEYESFVASAASKLGWKVLFRATDFPGLKNFMDINSNVFLIASDDFTRIDEISCREKLLLKSGRASAVRGAVDMPRNDSEFLQLVLSLLHSRETSFSALPVLESNVTVFGSIGRRVGTSTFAINYAAEIRALGHKVLFVDAHRAHPSASAILDIHGANRSIVRLDDFLSVVEIASHSMLNELTAQSHKYEFLIVDIGELVLGESTLVGLRLEDILMRISLNAAMRCNIFLEERILKTNELSPQLKHLKQFSNSMALQIFTFGDNALSRRERQAISREIEVNTGVGALPVIRDSRTLTAHEESHQPLAISAPRSNLRRQIQRVCQEQLELVDMSEA